MKYKAFSFLLLPAAVLLFASYYPNTPEQRKEEMLLKMITADLKAEHYQPVEINNEFSKKLFDLYLKRLDYNKTYLTREDVQKLKEHEYQLDNEIVDGNLSFFHLSIDLLNSRIPDIEKFYKDILSKPFDFTKDEEIETDAKKLEFCVNLKELKSRWYKGLKYQTLTRLVDNLEAQEKALEKKDTTVKIKTFSELEEEARSGVLKRTDDYFHRLSKVDDMDRLAVFLNSIVNLYDPHSDYFPPEDKENFDITMSGQLEGIGAQLQERDGYIKVASIVPGSPSWKQGQLKAGDIILKVGQGSQEPVDIVDMRLDHAVKLVRGKKGTEVRLTVKKVDGTTMVIPIIRDVVILEETFAKSLIIRKEGSDKKIGYLKLPSFYVNLSGSGGRSSSEDVRKEIEKLKNENISGLIFDVRDNGGGSLPDAVNIAGLFISKGPVVQVKSRAGQPYVYEDKDTATRYSGPLVVLENSFSASASEIFAAAIQDYRRGLIIGSPTTFGKGTVQRFTDLDRLLYAQDQSLKPLGSIKVTTQKFFRINGGATQLKGVNPDILLPDAYSYLDVGEKEMDYPLAWNKIDPVPYTPWQPTYNPEKVKQAFSDVTRTDSTFRLIDENARRLKNQEDNTVYSLNINKFRADKEALQKALKKYEHIGKNPLPQIVTALMADAPETEADSSRMNRSKAWMDEVKKDVYVWESLKVFETLNK